jgi:spermidine synthase
VREIARPSAVALVSAGSLAFEILLVRIFAIEHFYHFAYMAVGVAMLGFGATGTVVALMRHPSSTRMRRLFVWSCGLTAASFVLVPIVVQEVSVDPTQLAWDRRQWLTLALVYLLLALPFGLAALAIVTALTLTGDSPGYVYGASFLGSGVGAAACMVSLWLLPPDGALAVPPLLASGGFAIAVSTAGTAGRTRLLAPPMVGIALLTFAVPPWRLHVSPYKALPQVEAYPKAERVAERSSPLGWTVAVEAPAFRYAPGLSLAFNGVFPQQTGLFVDGTIAGAVPAVGSEAEAGAVLDWLPTSLPYALRSIQRVLVIGAGGGLEVRNALDHGVARVTGVELNSDLVALSLTPHLRAAEREGRLTWVIGDARSYVARTRQSFDLITLPPTGSLGTAAAGVHGLDEDFLHTTQAYRQYLRRLSPNGTLAITRWSSVPPRSSIRVILTAAEALRMSNAANVATSLIVARSWGTTTILARPAGFSHREVATLQEWAAERFFDLDWYPGATDPTTQYNYLEEPTPFQAAAAAVRGPPSSDQFPAEYPFDVAPVGDARPYPHRFLRLGSLLTLLQSERGSWLPFAEWGQIALTATLAQSALLAGVLMLLPAAIKRRPVGRVGWLPLAVYFGAIGFSYLGAEIAAIQQLSLLLGHPVYAVAIVLTAFLVSSGAGSMYSDRWLQANPWRICTGLAALLAVLGLALLPMVHWLQPAHLAVRSVVGAIVIAPLAFLMGTPFPMGLRSLAGDRAGPIAWAWAANGFASVVAAPGAALIGLTLGSPAVLLFAGLAYAVAALVSRLGRLRSAALVG